MIKTSPCFSRVCSLSAFSLICLKTHSFWGGSSVLCTSEGSPPHTQKTPPSPPRRGEPSPSRAPAASANGQMFELLNTNISVSHRNLQGFLLQAHTQSRADAKAIPRCLGASGNPILNIPRCADPFPLLRDVSHSSTTPVIAQLFGL